MSTALESAATPVDPRLEAVLSELLASLERPRPTVRFGFHDLEAPSEPETQPADGPLPPASAARQVSGLRSDDVARLSAQMERLATPPHELYPPLPAPTGRPEPWWLRLARRVAPSRG